jgi:hypothetical protein
MMTTPDPVNQAGATRPNRLRAAGSSLTTQLNLRQTAPWRDIIYTPDIDKLLAETALDDTDPDVAEQAARVIGRIRSQSAVKEIAERQRQGEEGALRALAYVADEALSLPRVVSFQAQLYAMLANTWRRLTLQPMHGVWRFLFALLGTWLAMGVYVWVNLPGLAIFNPDRWGKSVSWGLTIAFFMGLTVLIGSDLPTRLRGFWPWWLCALASLILGTLLGAITWWMFTFFFLNYAPDWGLMLQGGLGLGIAFAVTTVLHRMEGALTYVIAYISIFAPLALLAYQYLATRDLLGTWYVWVISGLVIALVAYLVYVLVQRFRGGLAVVITALGIYVPLFLAYQGWWADPVANAAIIYFRNYDEVYTQLIPMVISMAIGANAQAVWHDLRGLVRWGRAWLAARRSPPPNPAPAGQEV